MHYRGFNELELKKITEILERNGVQYQVGVPETAMDYINDPSKRVNHRFMDNLLEIEIEKAEFDKINEKDTSKLFDLRIYKEEESPYTEEELSKLDMEVKTLEKKPNKDARTNQIAAILAISAVTLFFLWRNKLL